MNPFRPGDKGGAAAPPVFRAPAATTVAPPVYRPGGGVQQQKPAAMAANVAPNRVMAGAPPPVYRPTPNAPSVKFAPVPLAVAAPKPVQMKPAMTAAPTAVRVTVPPALPARVVPPSTVQPMIRPPAFVQAPVVQRMIIDDDEDKDPSYFEKESTKKTPRPPFKTDAYARLAAKHGAVRCDGTEAKIKGRTPYWKYQHGTTWVYLTKDYQEMRADKVPTSWRKIDKDHQIDYIALIAALKEDPNLKPHEKDFALMLSAKSTRHLTFLPRHVHKVKKTYRVHTVPKTLKTAAKGLLAAKVTKKRIAKYRPAYLRLKNQHATNTAPAWSVENY